MLYDVKTPEEYLEMLESDWRKDKLQEVRAMIKGQAPHLIEGIAYKMLCYGNGATNIFHLTAQQAYVSLYVGTIDKIENARELLKEFNMGKGCIRIKESINLSETKIEVFIQKVLQTWNEGGNTDCEFPNYDY